MFSKEQHLSQCKATFPLTTRVLYSFLANYLSTEEIEVSCQRFSSPLDSSETNTPSEASPESQSESMSNYECNSIDLCELINFAKANETILALKDFICSGCGDTKQFHPRFVEIDTIYLLNKVSEEDHEELLDELTTLHPELRNNWSVSKSLSVVHKLMLMFIEAKAK